MPTIDQNKEMWDRTYDWSHAEDDWSAVWGDARTQWSYTLLPRLYPWLPTGTILEIAPGFGRWTQFLAHQCQRMVLVDLSQKCIQACQQRFSNCSHLSYYVNDGKNLDFIPDQSVDLAFSFDSLVHVEEDVLSAYLEQLAGKLSPDGVGFIHHSNLGEYKNYLAGVNKLPYRLKKLLSAKGLVETFEVQWRAANVTAAGFEQLARQAGLICISQEVINWQSQRPIDCISVFTRPGSRWARPNQVLRNPAFMREAQYAAELSKLYKSSAKEASGLRV